MSDAVSLYKLGADDFSLPGSRQTLRIDIYEMTDAELARALIKLLVIAVPSVRLSEWELSFCDGIGRAWAHYGKLTWKQRQTLGGCSLRSLCA